MLQCLAFRRRARPLFICFSTVSWVLGCASICAAQTTTSDNITVVLTSEEFQNALQDLAPHVLVMGHLDMVASPTLKPTDTGETDFLDNSLIRITPEIKSIVGNCTSAGPPPADFNLSEELPQGACAIRVKEDFMEVRARAFQTWIDRLYVAVAEPSADGTAVLFLHTGKLVWLTNCVLQGGGNDSRAIDLSSAEGESPRLYIEGSTITGFTKDWAPGIRMDNDTTLTLKNVTIKDMTLTPSKQGDEILGSAIAAQAGAGVLLEDVEIVDNVIHGQPAGPQAISIAAGEESAVIYSLPIMEVWQWPEGPTTMSEPTANSGDRGLGFPEADAQLAAIQAEQYAAVRDFFGISPPATPPLPPPPAIVPDPAPPPSQNPDPPPPRNPPSPPNADPTNATSAEPANPPTGNSSGSPAAAVSTGGANMEAAPMSVDPSSDNSASFGLAWIIGSSVAAATIVALIAACIMVVLLRRQRHREREERRKASGPVDTWLVQEGQDLWTGRTPSARSGESGRSIAAGTSTSALTHTATNSSSRSANATLSSGTAPSLGRRAHRLKRTGDPSDTSPSPHSINPMAGSLPQTGSQGSERHRQPHGALHDGHDDQRRSGLSVAATAGSMHPSVGTYPTFSMDVTEPDEIAAAPAPGSTAAAAAKYARPPLTTPSRSRSGSGSGIPASGLKVQAGLGGAPSSAGSALAERIWPSPSGVSSSSAAGRGMGSVAMVSLAAQSIQQSMQQTPLLAGDTISSMGIAMPASSRDLSSCAVAHSSHTLGTLFDTIPVELPALPAPTTEDRQAGCVMPPDLLEHALDNMSAAQELFMGQFRLLGPMERRGGGQGLVQFAQVDRSGDPVAIKFFVNNRAFETEREHYSKEHLRGMMPAVTLMHSNADGTICTEEGWRFPPIIVVERGESLDEWQAHVQPDFATVVQVLSHISQRVCTLHAAGVAHRDLKPGNVLWRPKHHSWTLIDYGCAAEIGANSRLTFSVSYSPPETLMTLRSGARSIRSDPAADIWAIGLIAYELIHRSRAFREFSWTFTDVLDAAAGSRAYPWEDPGRPGSFQRDPDLRALGSVVRACLTREPSKRPTASQLVQKLNQLFDSHGTTMGPATNSVVLPNTAAPSSVLPTSSVLADSAALQGELRADRPLGRGLHGPVATPPSMLTPSRNRASGASANPRQPSAALARTAEVSADGVLQAGAHTMALVESLPGTVVLAIQDNLVEDGGSPAGGARVVADSLPTSCAFAKTGEAADIEADGAASTPVTPRPALVECAVSASGAGGSTAAGGSEVNDDAWHL